MFVLSPKYGPRGDLLFLLPTQHQKNKKEKQRSNAIFQDSRVVQFHCSDGSQIAVPCASPERQVPTKLPYSGKNTRVETCDDSRASGQKNLRYPSDVRRRRFHTILSCTSPASGRPHVLQMRSAMHSQQLPMHPGRRLLPPRVNCKCNPTPGRAEDQPRRSNQSPALSRLRVRDYSSTVRQLIRRVRAHPTPLQYLRTALSQ